MKISNFPNLSFLLNSTCSKPSLIYSQSDLAEVPQLIINRAHASIRCSKSPAFYSVTNTMCAQLGIPRHTPRHRNQPHVRLLVHSVQCPHIFQLAATLPSIHLFTLPMRKTSKSCQQSRSRVNDLVSCSGMTQGRCLCMFIVRLEEAPWEPAGHPRAPASSLWLLRSPQMKAGRK